MMSDTMPKDLPVVKSKRASVKETDRPIGISEEVWSLGKSIGNVAMADAIVATDNGVLPSDPDALNDFLVATSGEATKALKRYLRLNSTIGKQLSEAYKLWRSHKQREARLFAIIANDGKLPESQDATPAIG